MDHEIVTVAEVAEFLRVSVRTVYRLVEHDELRAIRVGGGIRFRRADVQAFVDEQPVTND